MAGDDTRIIIVGLPTVARELGADVESIIWLSQSCLLASTVGLLLIGRITDVVGRVKIYNIGGTASAGLAILLITTGIPYSVFSSLLRSMNPVAMGRLPEQGFINGFKVASLVFGIINTGVIIQSFLRGPGKTGLWIVSTSLPDPVVPVFGLLIAFPVLFPAECGGS
jgi:MFS family permease